MSWPWAYNVQSNLCKLCYSLPFLCLASGVGTWSFDEVREKYFYSTLEERERSFSSVTEYSEPKILNEELWISLFQQELSLVSSSVYCLHIKLFKPRIIPKSPWTKHFVIDWLLRRGSLPLVNLDQTILISRF